MRDVASYDPTRPSATPTFYLTTIKMEPFSVAEKCEAIATISKCAAWKELVKYPLCLRGTGTPLVVRRNLIRVPREVVEEMDDHWETNIGRYVLNATCTCNDYTGGWCKHVAALSFALVEWCECRPPLLLVSLGIDLSLLHQEARGGPEPGEVRKRLPDFDCFPVSMSAKRATTSPW